MYSFPGGPPGGAPQANRHAPLGSITPGTATGVAPISTQGYGFRPAPLQHTGTFPYQQPPQQQQQYQYQQPPPPPPPSFPQQSPQQPYFHPQGLHPPPLPSTSPHQQQYSWSPQASQGGYNPAAPTPQFGPQANSGSGYNPNGRPIVHGQYVPSSTYGSHATGQPAPPPPQHQYQYQVPMPPPPPPPPPPQAQQSPQQWNRLSYQQQPYQQQQEQQQQLPPPPPQQNYGQSENQWNSNQPQQFQPQQLQPPAPQQQPPPLGDYYSMSQPPAPAAGGASLDNTQNQSSYQFGQPQQPVSPPLGQPTIFSAGGGGYSHLNNPVSTPTPPPPPPPPAPLPFHPAAPSNDYTYSQNAQVYNNEPAKQTSPPQPHHLLSQQIYTSATATPPPPPPPTEQHYLPVPPPVLPIAPATSTAYTYTPPIAHSEPPSKPTPPSALQQHQPPQQHTFAAAASPPPALQTQPQPPLKDYRWVPTPPPKPPTPKAPEPPKQTGSAWTSASVFTGGLTSWDTYYADGPGDDEESVTAEKSSEAGSPVKHSENDVQQPDEVAVEPVSTKAAADVIEQKVADVLQPLSHQDPIAGPIAPPPQMNVSYITSDAPPPSQEPALHPQSQPWLQQSTIITPSVEPTTTFVIGDIPPPAQSATLADSSFKAPTMDDIVVGAPFVQAAQPDTTTITQQPGQQTTTQDEEDATIERLQELDQFYQDSITRFIDMIEAEAAAPRDEDKLRVFKNFMEQEYFIRGQKYPLAIGDPPSRQSSLARLPAVEEARSTAATPAVEGTATPPTALVENEQPPVHVEPSFSEPVISSQPGQAPLTVHMPPAAIQSQSEPVADPSALSTSVHASAQPIECRPHEQPEQYAAQKADQPLSQPQHPQHPHEQYSEQHERYLAHGREQDPHNPQEHPPQLQDQYHQQPRQQYPEQQERYPTQSQQQHSPQEQYVEQHERYPVSKPEQRPPQSQEQYAEQQEQYAEQQDHYPTTTPQKGLKRDEIVEPPAAFAYTPFRPSVIDKCLPPQGPSKPTSPKTQSPAPEPPRAEHPRYAPYKPGTVPASSIQRRISFSGEQALVDAATAQYRTSQYRPFHKDAKVNPLDKTPTAQQLEFGPFRRAGTTVDMDLPMNLSLRVDETFLPVKEKAADDFFPAGPEETMEEPIPPAPPAARDTVTRDLARLLPPKGATREKSRALEDMELELTKISDDFSFIDRLTSEFETKELTNRKRLEDERRARQEEHQDYTDGLFSANKVGYGDISDMDEEFNKKEELILKEEEKTAYKRYEAEVFELVYNQLQGGIKKVMDLHFRTTRDFLGNSVAGRDRWNTAGRAERDAALQMLVRLDEMAEKRHAKVQEAIVARDRKFRKTVTEPLKAVSDFKKMNTMIKHFDDSERKLILASCREKQLRTRTLLSVVNRAVDAGLDEDLGYIMQLTTEINKILATLPGPPSAYTGDKVRLKEDLLHAQDTLKSCLQVAESLMKVAHVASLAMNAADHAVSLAEAKVKGEDEKQVEDMHRLANEAADAELEERVQRMMHEYGVVVGNLEMVHGGLSMTATTPSQVEKSRALGPTSPGR